ncbi:MAG: exodeoxyribonuclease V subunit beta [Pseudomonadota bacterium]
MKEIKNVGLLDSPLEGINLIEASAGTGKTYTLSGLFLRLILEKYLSVNEILVVTFTVAATQELRDRIRKNLREAIEAFSRGQSDDSFLNALVKKHENPKDALRQLDAALRNFDEAAIYTIHGLCQRMLRENAFESSSLFDTELILEQETLKQEIVDDFWRRWFYQASPLLVNYAIRNNYCSDKLLGLLRNHTTFPYLTIIPQVSIPDTRSQEQEFREGFDELCRHWYSSRAEVEEILTTHPGLSRTSYKNASIPVWIERMDDYMTSGGNDPVLFDKFDKFTTSTIENAMKKNHKPPYHPFFELAQVVKERSGELCRVFDQYLLGLKIILFDYVQKELSKRKQKENRQSFDDLLIKLRNALAGKEGEELAEAIRKKYRAALIDEFQDTDPIQYAIFTNIFNQGNRILFFIGDPKQAIYSFRGADIFAYLNATGYVDSKYTLGENWRSDPDLLTAINTLFSRAENPFVYDEISFIRALPAKTRSPEVLRINGKSAPPLQFWFLPLNKLDESLLTHDRQFIKKASAQELVARAVGAEISRLLTLGREDKALIGEKPVTEGDIAVLVRKNREARLMQKVLSDLTIPSVLYSEANLFQSHEAMEVERVLGGIAEPNNERLLKAALTTDMMGVAGEELEGVIEHELGWEGWLRKFSEYHGMWRKSTFIRMFRYVMSREHVRNRLLSFPDGERRLTNVLHLSEVLHQEATKRKRGMTGLLNWLSERRNQDVPQLAEHQLRLESDEHAVKVVTIHKSKGLEYPIVFCPFLWDGSKINQRSDDYVRFHDEANHWMLTLDLGSETKDKNCAQAERELLAENLRLFYVALTRAKNRCYTVWGRFNDAGTSAMAYLFHQAGKMEKEETLDKIDATFKGLDDDAIKESLQTFEREAGGAIHLQEVPLSEERNYSPPETIKEELTPRKFSGRIDCTWKVSSFSSLIADQQHEAEGSHAASLDLPGYDDSVFGEKVTEEEPVGIFAFPKGTKAGTFMHDLFEHLDFAEKDALVMKSLVADKLRQYGFEAHWQEMVCGMITKVLSVPLNPDRKDFTLSRIPTTDRISELEFYFPLQPISPEKLKNIFLTYGGLELPEEFPDHLERLDFQPAKGFMKGYTDLVFQCNGSFYLVDWKSNYLGSRVEDYNQETLARVMEEKSYFLQYHLYTLALHQYLNLRLPGYQYNRHFGGVYYLFLRGMDPEKGPAFGIYRARPAENVIHELCKHLIAPLKR